MKELKARIREVFEGPQLAALATVTEDGKPWVRYVMSLMDEDLTIRVATSTTTRKVEQIANRPDVHLTAGVANLPTAKRWVQIEGTAELSTDADVKAAFWNEKLRMYFKGPTDPDYGVLQIRPRRIEYWTMTSEQPKTLVIEQ